MRILSKMPKERYGEKSVRKQKNNSAVCHYTHCFSGGRFDDLFHDKRKGL